MVKKKVSKKGVNKNLVIGVVVVAVVAVILASYFIFNNLDKGDLDKEDLLEESLNAEKGTEEITQQIIEPTDSSLSGFVKSKLKFSSTRYEDTILETIDCLDKSKFITCPEENKKFIPGYHFNPLRTGYTGDCVEVSDCKNKFMEKRLELAKLNIISFLNPNLENSFNKCFVDVASHRYNQDGVNKLILRKNFNECFKRELGEEITYEEASCTEDWVDISYSEYVDRNRCGTEYDKPTIKESAIEESTSESEGKTVSQIDCGTVPSNVDYNDPNYLDNNPTIKSMFECSSNNLRDCNPSRITYLGPATNTYTNTFIVKEKSGSICKINYESESSNYEAGKMNVECDMSLDEIQNIYNTAKNEGKEELTSFILSLALGFEMTSYSPGGTFEFGDTNNPCRFY